MKYIFTLFLYAIAAVVLGISLVPALVFLVVVLKLTREWPAFLRYPALCSAAAMAYFVFGITLTIVTPLFSQLLGLRLRPGEYPMNSAMAVKWYLLNAFQTLVTNCFMNFMILTPFVVLFFKLMGAKVGKNTQINSTFCADLPLLEIGDGAVIGGHATVIGHSFERGQLILNRVKIGRKAVIGLNAVVLPGCEIGDGATVAASAVVPKNTKIEPNTVFYGQLKP